MVDPALFMSAVKQTEGGSRNAGAVCCFGFEGPEEVVVGGCFWSLPTTTGPPTLTRRTVTARTAEREKNNSSEDEDGKQPVRVGGTTAEEDGGGTVRPPPPPEQGLPSVSLLPPSEGFDLRFLGSKLQEQPALSPGQRWTLDLDLDLDLGSSPWIWIWIWTLDLVPGS